MVDLEEFGWSPYDTLEVVTWEHEHAILYRCPRCGAMVRFDDQTLHTQDHLEAAK